MPASSLRADSAQALVDLAVASLSFTVRQAARELGVSYGGANALVGQLTRLGILEVRPGGQPRFAPAVLEVLLRRP